MGRVRIWQVVVVAVVVEAVGLSAAAAFTFFADRTLGGPAWLLAPAAALVAAGVKAVADALSHPEPVRQASTWDRPVEPVRRRGLPALAAVLAALLVLGVAGYGAAVGVRYAVGRITGNERGVERLAAPRSGKSGRVTVTVTSVVHTPHFTRVGLTVSNGEEQPATLTVFHNCVVSAGDVTLQADPFRSGWTEEVPPGSTQHGTVTFPGHLPDGEVSAQLSFLDVFVFGRFDAKTSVVIKAIRLHGV